MTSPEAAPAEDTSADPGELRRLRDENHRLRLLLDGVRGARTYRLMVAAGRWRAFDQKVTEVLEAQRRPGFLRWSAPIAPPRAEAPRKRTIGIDLTALLPGGANGGAKVATLELVRALVHHSTDIDFVVFQQPGANQKLGLDRAPNLIVHESGLDPGALTRFVDQNPISCLYCPMTTPPWHDPRVPLVSQIHDIQHETYSEFFTPEELAGRRAMHARTIRWSDRLLVSTSYVRDSLLNRLGTAPEQIRVVPFRMGDRLFRHHISSLDRERTLERLGLFSHPFFFYPANFWHHKNHHLLLTAFARFTHDQPELDHRLVFTGANQPNPSSVLGWADQLGIGDRVHYLGFVGEDEMAALFAGARALLFPSLYEGFGLPILEAMVHGCPVLCGDRTAMPEVAGDAALQVDPRNVDQIYDGIKRLALDDQLVADLRQRGEARAKSFVGIEHQAAAVLEVLDEVIRTPRAIEATLVGLWADGWTSNTLHLFYGAEREVLLRFVNPSSHPILLRGAEGQNVQLGAQEQIAIRCELPGQPGRFTFQIAASRRSTADPRELGLLFVAADTLGANPTDLLSF